MSKSVIFLLLVFFPISDAGAASEAVSVTYSLETCIETAYDYAPILNAGAARLDSAHALTELKKTEFAPVFSMSGSTGYYSGESVTAYSAARDILEEQSKLSVSSMFYQGTLRGEVPLYKNGAWLGSLSDAVRAAEIGAEEQEWINRDIHISVAIAVARSYIFALKHLRAADTEKKIVELRRRNYDLLQAKADQHLISENEVLKARVRVAEAEKNFGMNARAADYYKQSLLSLMGADAAVSFELQDIPDSGMIPQIEILIEDVRKNHPLIKAQEARVRKLRADAESVRSENKPRLFLTAEYNLANGFKDRIKDNFISAIKAEIPFSDGGQTEKKAAEVLARVKAEEKQLLVIKQELEEKIRDLYFQAEQTDIQIELIRHQIEQLSEEVRLHDAMFRQNLIPRSAVYDSDARLLQSESERSSLGYDRKTIVFQLELMRSEK